MVVVKYEVNCPFCNALHKGELVMEYRKDKKFNVRKNNKNMHVCENVECNREFVVEIDSYGKVAAMPLKVTPGDKWSFPWEALIEGKVIKVID